ncbi:hypothetical protein BDF19DRAFT_425315 [Syncephalis fuscata]|nr:hypothetical protein BDF19DRAFT_425315 [Syncephalis fuscata]
MVDQHGPGVNVGHPMAHHHAHSQSMSSGVPTSMAAHMGGNGANAGASSMQMNGPTSIPGTPGQPGGSGQPPSGQAPPSTAQAAQSQQQQQQQAPQSQQPTTATQRLAAINEQTWIQLGSIADQMQEFDRAISCFESALRHNPYSVPALTKIGVLCKSRNQFQRAVEYFQRIINVDSNNGEIWGLLGHCYLLMDDLQKAYNAYQQALYLLPNANDAKLWYGIGILYDRYGSYEHAEEAFSVSLRIDPKYEKAGEIYFRLGIIYKQLQKYNISLDCFRYILPNPPPPLSELDIWFQIGNVHEQQKEVIKLNNYFITNIYTISTVCIGKEAFERVLAANPNHAKALQQLGWLYHQPQCTFHNQDHAVQCMTRSLEIDANDPQSWYLLGRCYMAKQNHNKAYEAYQQAVYRDSRNPTYWCSIGVLYYQINQYRDALDAYTRAIRLNHTSVKFGMYDLGTLYESCNSNQINDALDAYQRAAELDPSNPHIKQRLQLLRSRQANGGAAIQTSAPMPQDVNPAAYQSQSGYNGPPGMSTQGPPSTPFHPHPPSAPPSSTANTFPHRAGGPPSMHEQGRLPAPNMRQNGDHRPPTSGSMPHGPSSAHATPRIPDINGYHHGSPTHGQTTMPPMQQHPPNGPPQPLHGGPESRLPSVSSLPPPPSSHGAGTVPSPAAGIAAPIGSMSHHPQHPQQHQHSHSHDRAEGSIKMEPGMHANGATLPEMAHRPPPPPSSTVPPQHYHQRNLSINGLASSADLTHRRSPSTKVERESSAQPATNTLPPHQSSSSAISQTTPPTSTATRVIDDNYDEDVVSALVSMSGGRTNAAIMPEPNGNASTTVEATTATVLPPSVQNPGKRSLSPTLEPVPDAAQKRSKMDDNAPQDVTPLPPTTMTSSQVADVTVTATAKIPAASLLSPPSPEQPNPTASTASPPASSVSPQQASHNTTGTSSHNHHLHNNGITNNDDDDDAEDGEIVDDAPSTSAEPSATSVTPPS